MYKVAHLNCVKKHEFSFSEHHLEKPLRLLFISDIHRRTIHSSIIQNVAGQVDVVIIGGDLLEKGVPLNRIDKNLQKLRSLGQIYFVWGNNDQEISRASLLNIFRKWDVHVLKNESIMMQHGQKEYAIVGLDDLLTGKVDLDLSLEGVSKTAFKILVSHNPNVMNLIRKENGISLVLSGHTHGGQIRILGYGPYELGKTHVIDEVIQIISNGYGTTGVPLRLKAKPETHHIIINSF
jgi:uncharacterized protein